MLSSSILFAQDTAKSIPLTVSPTGFDYWYIVIFAVGMIAHFIVHVGKAVGWQKLFNTFPAQFSCWFFNKFHLTLISGAAAAILGTASQWGLNVPFATLNAMGIAVAVASGYIGDSVFNGGTPVPPAGK